MRTDRYRYTEWKTEQGELVGLELYDHRNDPEENVNLAARPGHEKLLEELRRKLSDGWRAARPESVRIKGRT
jgi:iduronate 2-sulfatase